MLKKIKISFVFNFWIQTTTATCTTPPKKIQVHFFA